MRSERRRHSSQHHHLSGADASEHGGPERRTRSGRDQQPHTPRDVNLRQRSPRPYTNAYNTRQADEATAPVGYAMTDGQTRYETDDRPTKKAAQQTARTPVTSPNVRMKASDPRQTDSADALAVGRKERPVLSTPAHRHRRLVTQSGAQQGKQREGTEHATHRATENRYEESERQEALRSETMTRRKANAA